MSVPQTKDPLERISWAASIPFFLIHLAPLGALWTGVTWFDIGLCVFLYYTRMFFITGGYHRLFAHRAYKVHRITQFLMAFGGATAAQKGMLWWSGHHRHHHRYSDLPEDVHSPKKGFWWSQVGWIIAYKYDETPIDLIKDFAKFPELVWLNKHYLVPPTILGVAVYYLFGPSALFTGFFLSTVFLYHGTFFVNSMAHLTGTRRFATTDTSRNCWWVALLACGEGWHNNHHHYQSSANNGFYWWEIDLSYYVIRVMGLLGLAWDIRLPPESALKRNLIAEGAYDIGMLGPRADGATPALAPDSEPEPDLEPVPAE